MADHNKAAAELLKPQDPAQDAAADNSAKSDMPTTYDPKAAEQKWYAYWMEKEFFKAGMRPEAEPYSIVIPPPNVTGMLHIGHALDFTLQDILIRTKRMQGFDTLWLPGTDHAGIATQTKVEQKLRQQACPGMIWAARNSWSRYGSGRTSMPTPFMSSGPRWACPSTIRASGSLWIKGCPAVYARYLWSYTVKD